MQALISMLMGLGSKNEDILQFVETDLVSKAVESLNSDVLPYSLSLFDDDPVPTNQRNLTDVRTRMGILLEYELGKAMQAVVPAVIRDDVALTYVISNKFPDLAYRGAKGDFGLRFEVKAIQTIAEEKSANFDTLVKDIRRGTDFIIVLVWEWRRHASSPFRYPHIDAAYVFDAYQLAQMRDCYWLNTPPSNVGEARQGFDLCFGVNCGDSKYNKEEGNYGKLMRIFSPEFEKYLPAGIKGGTTLTSYYEFVKLTCTLGLDRITAEVALEFAGEETLREKIKSTSVEVGYLVKHPKQRVLFVGSREKPSKTNVQAVMKQFQAHRVMTFNHKFQWDVRDEVYAEKGSGKKPEEARLWARNQKIRLG